MTATRLTPAQRLRRMHDQLSAAYGPQHWWPAETPFEMILGAYLTQNTAWKAVERSLANLRAAGALTIDGLRSLPLEELQRLIQPSGFLTRKAPALKAFVAMLDEEFGGSLETLGRQRPRPPCAPACWRCPALVRKPPTPFCSTRSAMLFPSPTSICAASSNATLARTRTRPHRKGYELLADSLARPLPPTPRRIRRPALQRVSRPHGRRRQGSLPQNRSL